MIISRTPLRISLGGGGTDLPAFYETQGHGFLIAAAITKYIYIAVNHRFDEEILVKYSKLEKVTNLNDIQHPLLRECLKSVDARGSIEISAMADIPGGTGLGSSGAFAVGALKALNMHFHKAPERHRLAEEACEIEMNYLSEPVGKQDPYIAAYGGVTGFSFHADGTVEVQPLDMAPRLRALLDDNLLLFYTGIQRAASEVLAEEALTGPFETNSRSDNLKRTRAIGYETRDALVAGDMDGFAKLLTQQWRLKYERQPNPLNGRFDNWIKSGLDAGALGGKLVGAGGGGFLLFYADKKTDLRDVMSEFGLHETFFDIDYEGSTIIVAR